MSEACLATLILVLLVDSPVFDLEIEDEVVVSLTAPNFRDLYIAIKLGPELGFVLLNLVKVLAKLCKYFSNEKKTFQKIETTFFLNPDKDLKILI